MAFADKATAASVADHKFNAATWELEAKLGREVTEIEVYAYLFDCEPFEWEDHIVRSTN